MNQLSIEERHLEEADAHIRKAEQAIAEQEQRCLTFGPDSPNLVEGGHLLTVMRQTLEQFQAHRRLIVERVHALSREHRPPP